MTLKQLIARVMRALPNLPPGAIGEPEIIDMLNEAQRSLAILSNRINTKETTLLAGVDTVNFPTDLMKLVAVYWGDAKTKRELYPEKERLPTDNYAEEDTGWPVKYYTITKKVVLRPIPTQGNTVTIAYIGKPVDMVEDADLPDLDGSDEYLIAHALHRIHLEANSQAFQIWEMEKMRAEQEWRASSDQNYEVPFNVTGSW